MVYVVAVRTGVGQRLDNDALLGRSLNPRVQHAASRLLRSIDVSSLALIGGTIVLIALARHRPRLAVGAAVLIWGATATSETLKRVVLSRPELAHPDRLSFPTFPSGHTTVAASLALAAIIVVPARWRGLVAIAGTLYAAGVGAGTVTAAWHRPSDVIGGLLVAVLWASAVVAWLGPDPPAETRAGRRQARESGRLVVPLLVVVALVLIAVGLAFAGMLHAVQDRHLQSVPLGAAYAGSVVAIVATGAVLVAGFLWCLHQTVPPTEEAVPPDRGAPVPAPVRAAQT